MPESYGFDDVVDELAEFIRRGREQRTAEEAERRRRREHERTMEKAYRDLDLMVKALPKPAPVNVEPNRGAEVIAKAFDVLRTDGSLNAAQRGRLSSASAQLPIASSLNPSTQWWRASTRSWRCSTPRWLKSTSAAPSR
jgi:hypothetical protein